MGLRRDYKWKTNSSYYSEEHIGKILEDLNISVVSETEKVFLTLCPFHVNTYTPAFAVSKVSGAYYCHNPSCNAKGSLQQLVMSARSKDIVDAQHFISQRYKPVDYVALAKRELAEVEFQKFDQSTIDRLKHQFPGSEGEAYMINRGFNSDTLDYFDIGYSEVKRSVTVPMHTDIGMPIGLIARSVDQKKFHNSVGLPKSATAWNMHRAKHGGGTLIITEASFDAMRVHQAGYPNVVALLGGSLSRRIIRQLERYATTIIIATDNDEAGRALGKSIQDKVKAKIMWAASGPEIYPHDAKDMSDLTDDEIRHVLSHAVHSMVYSSWFE